MNRVAVGVRRLAAALLGGCLGLGCMAVQAAELKLLTAGAFKPVVMATLPLFEQRSGHHVSVDSDTTGGLARRVAAGEAFDVVVLTRPALDALVPGGRLAPGTVQALARVGIGVAVKAGAPLPDIGSVAAFQRTLLAARAIATVDPAAGGTSGIYLWQLFDTMGMTAALRPKAVLVPGGLAAQKLLTGEADLVLQQTSELMAVAGVTVVGPLPAEIQRETVYAGALAAAAAQRDAAWALITFLAGPEARAVLAAQGLQAP